MGALAIYNVKAPCKQWPILASADDAEGAPTRPTGSAPPEREHPPHAPCDERSSVSPVPTNTPEMPLPAEFSHPALQDLVRAGRTTGQVTGEQVAQAIIAAGVRANRGRVVLTALAGQGIEVSMTAPDRAVAATTAAAKGTTSVTTKKAAAKKAAPKKKAAAKKAAPKKKAAAKKK